MIKNELSEKLLRLLSLMVVVGFVLISCEDKPPTDYIPENYVEGYLIVDQPIQNIIVMRTQALADSFKYENALIRDASVRITGDNRVFDLIIDGSGELGYYDPDGTYRVKSNTEYSLEVNIDGEILTGKTTTPNRTRWIEKSPDPLQYPIDTINYPDRYQISWEKVPGINFFILSVINLDTLDYGKYLDPPTEESNRRVKRFKSRESFYNDKSNWAFIANNETSIVWSIFKWFGKHEITVYVPDWNYTEWFIQNIAAREYEPLLGSIEGGIGVFGSAAAIKDTFLLLKNQP